MLQEIIHLLNSQSLGLTHSTNLVSLLLLTHSIKLWLTEFYIHQLRENVTEPTDGALGIGHGALGTLLSQVEVLGIGLVAEQGVEGERICVKL